MDRRQRAKDHKSIYRPERFKVLQKKCDLPKNVWITEDLIWENRELKKKPRDVVKEAFESESRVLDDRYPPFECEEFEESWVSHQDIVNGPRF
ncbi:unnamed protein product [Pocillopora meandrina]|uniref:Uncharacterized protein n=1 Tax=Pocillopora meandrina TaxID=46732 RepID=A0AAU9VSV9_9CNID|nr:unnamed protein product [Pocillopora meandrina]